MRLLMWTLQLSTLAMRLPLGCGQLLVGAHTLGMVPELEVLLMW